jgi:TPP-dependent pyruvate/acetoin dehydrogenase alpha subunit
MVNTPTSTPTSAPNQAASSSAIRRIEEDDAPEPVGREELLPLYRQILAIRRMEEASAKAYSQGKIGGFLHLIIGRRRCASAPSRRPRRRTTWWPPTASTATPTPRG